MFCIWLRFSHISVCFDDANFVSARSFCVHLFQMLYVFVGNIKQHRSVLNLLNNGSRRQARRNFFNCISLCSCFRHSFVPIAVQTFDVFIKSNSCMRIAQLVLAVGFHAMGRIDEKLFVRRRYADHLNLSWKPNGFQSTWNPHDKVVCLFINREVLGRAYHLSSNLCCFDSLSKLIPPAYFFLSISAYRLHLFWFESTLFTNTKLCKRV